LTRILLLTEEPFLRAGLEAVILRSPGLELLPHSSESPSDIAAAIAQKPDIVLVDVTAAVNYGVLLGMTQALRNVKVLLWVNEITLELAFQAMGLGVRGVLRKTLPAAQQVESIQRVAAGELWFEKTLTDRFMRAKKVKLSRREGQLICLLAHGMTNAEIGYQLGITEGTVKVYFSRLFEKVGVQGRLELALYGIRNLTPDQRQPPPGSDMPGLRSLVIEAPAGDSAPTGDILSGPGGSVRNWRGENAA
jgi:DNA-binding NarL/FixJ family response regulator